MSCHRDLDIAKHPYFKFYKYVLMSFGLWPNQSKAMERAIFFFFTFLVLSLLVPLVKYFIFQTIIYSTGCYFYIILYVQSKNIFHKIS